MPISSDTPILEEDDFCESCGGSEEVGELTLPGDIKFMVCRTCHEGGRFEQWFIDEFKKFMEESPDYERLEDGRYRYVGVE